MRIIFLNLILFFSPLVCFSCPTDYFCPGERVLSTHSNPSGFTTYTAGRVVQLYQNGTIGVLFDDTKIVIVVPAQELAKATNCFGDYCRGRKALYPATGEIWLIDEVFENGIIALRTFRGFLKVSQVDEFVPSVGCLNNICQGDPVANIQYGLTGFAVEIFKNGLVQFKSANFPGPSDLVSIDLLRKRIF